jgi:hypothetical protein
MPRNRDDSSDVENVDLGTVSIQAHPEPYVICAEHGYHPTFQIGSNGWIGQPMCAQCVGEVLEYLVQKKQKFFRETGYGNRNWSEDWILENPNR